MKLLNHVQVGCQYRVCVGMRAAALSVVSTKQSDTLYWCPLMQRLCDTTHTRVAKPEELRVNGALRPGTELASKSAANTVWLPDEWKALRESKAVVE